jgi:hypothetical protein
VIDSLTQEFRYEAPDGLPDCDPGSVTDWLEAALARNLEQVKAEVEQDAVFGFDFLIERASGAPLIARAPAIGL